MPARAAAHRQPRDAFVLGGNHRVTCSIALPAKASRRSVTLAGLLTPGRVAASLARDTYWLRLLRSPRRPNDVCSVRSRSQRRGRSGFYRIPYSSSRPKRPDTSDRTALYRRKRGPSSAARTSKTYPTLSHPSCGIAAHSPAPRPCPTGYNATGSRRLKGRERLRYRAGRRRRHHGLQAGPQRLSHGARFGYGRQNAKRKRACIGLTCPRSMYQLLRELARAARADSAPQSCTAIKGPGDAP